MVAEVVPPMHQDSLDSRFVALIGLNRGCDLRHPWCDEPSSFCWSANPLPYALRPKARTLPRATAAVSSVVTPPCHCRQCRSIRSASLIAGPHPQTRSASAGATGGAFTRSDVWSGLEERLQFCSEVTLRHSPFQLSMDGESAFRIIH